MILNLPLSLGTLRGILDREVAAAPHLDGLRRFNHLMVSELGKCCPLAGRAVLDLGASVHGYALEGALERGVARYEGIDWGVAWHWGAQSVEVAGPDGRTGNLRQMDAEQLDFPDGTFDCLLSVSTFEHFHGPERVLAEMFRVLRPGGAALVSFEPVWTASYGHHLHHFGEVSRLVPPWSHLYLSKEQMRAVLARQDWPAGAPIDREGALRWIYEGDGINRRDLQHLKGCFEASAFALDWMVPLPDETDPTYPVVANYLSRVLPYTADELLTRGLSLVLRKR